MATVEFDSGYAPCGFLVVKTGGDMYDDKDTILIQSDWDFHGVASTMGWVPCKECDKTGGHTDGTVDCPHKTVSDMIAEAYDFCEAHAGEEFEALDEYLTNQEEA